LQQASFAFIHTLYSVSAKGRYFKERKNYSCSWNRSSKQILCFTVINSRCKL